MKAALFVEDYAKHAALNFGQTMHGLRNLFSHPDFDDVAPRGSFKHFFLSLSLRARRVANDFSFSVIPPHWHHTADELRIMRTISISRWFTYGYAAWRFTEAGEAKSDLSGADPRWDPRCR